MQQSTIKNVSKSKSRLEIDFDHVVEKCTVMTATLSLSLSMIFTWVDRF